MAEEFKLSPEEAVILRIGKIGYGGGLQLPSMFNSNELILTNKNLILLKKNMFGQTEDTLYFPLSKILMANGRPQVKKSNPSHMEYARYPLLPAFQDPDGERQAPGQEEQSVPHGVRSGCLF